MKKKTEIILVVLNVLAWIAFIGLLIKAGVMLTSFFITFLNPTKAKTMYEGVDVSSLRQLGNLHYWGVVSFMFALIALKAYIAYLVLQVLSKIKLTNPFTEEVSYMLERISYYILSLWIVAVLNNSYLKWLAKSTDVVVTNQVSDEFIFLAGVVFVFAQVFKKGVELQSESELTV